MQPAPAAAPQQQGPSLAPIQATPDQARYGPPLPPNVQAAHYQQPIGMNPRR
jgi:hypothetical protein